MLVLTRKLNEAIIIGGHIRVKILRVEGESISLGIDAPRHVTVHREEIQELIQKQKQELK